MKRPVSVRAAVVLAALLLLSLCLIALRAGRPVPGGDEPTTVYLAGQGEKYHRAGCRYLDAGGTALSLADARAAHYGPCAVCDPPR